MNTWINLPIQLDGEKLKLLPLNEEYFDELIAVSKHPLIWTYMPVNGTQPALLRNALNEALQKRDKGEQYPFVVVNKATGKLIGSTRFLQINPEHRNLEIGYTWYLPDYWGKGYNEECKWLLLKYCFEVLNTVRVQLIAWDKNLRSRQAIERIGATFEGIQRNVIIRNGEKRSIAYYSILDEDWKMVEPKLKKMMTERQRPNQ